MFIIEGGIGVTDVGTARERIGWPPKDINNIYNNQFNTICWINNERNFQIHQWIDKFFVTVILFHTPEETFKITSNKPRVNQANKNHPQLV